MKKMGFVAAMRDFFGFLPGQSTGGFAIELKALSAEERDWFRANLATVGYEITEAQPIAA